MILFNLNSEIWKFWGHYLRIIFVFFAVEFGKIFIRKIFFFRVFLAKIFCCCARRAGGAPRAYAAIFQGPFCKASRTGLAFEALLPCYKGVSCYKGVWRALPLLEYGGMGIH